MRALLMFAVQMAAYLLGRSYDTLTALGFSAGIQMWENPFVLEYAGFLFSYGAVLGVAVIAAVLKEPASKDADQRCSGTSFFRRIFKKQRDRKEKTAQGAPKEHDSAWKKWLGRFGDALFISGCIQLATLPLSPKNCQKSSLAL